MDLLEKVRLLPTSPGVYLYKDAENKTIYVGKAKNLRSRVRSYFLEGRAIGDAKTGSLLREAADVDCIVVDNEGEALALENNLIKQFKPRFNVLLRDDKTYPYIRLSREKYPRVYVTRRLRKDGSEYFGPYFPASLAHRLVHFVHRHFLVPSCTIDLTRKHAKPCLQYHIHRCLGPCARLTTDEAYERAVRDTRLFLAGRHGDLLRTLRQRRDEAAAQQRFEEAASWRDLVSVVEDVQERQKMAAAEGDDADIVGLWREGDRAAVNIFHMRRGRMVDRRELFWEDLPVDTDFDPQPGGTPNPPAQPASDEQFASLAALEDANASALGAPSDDSSVMGAKSADFAVMGAKSSDFVVMGAKSSDFAYASEAPVRNAGTRPGTDRVSSALLGSVLKQLYLGQQYVPRQVIVSTDFEDRALLEELLTEQRHAPMQFVIPQRGARKQMIDLAQRNAHHSFEQRFRVLKPSGRAIQEALQDALNLPELPERIECFDISHFQGAETVASMVVWEKGRMKKSDYRKFIIRTVIGVDDFRSMEEVTTRRYRAVQEKGEPLPSLVLVDGGLGQLHSAQKALESLGLAAQPLASIAKREEVIYVAGQEDEPVVLERHSPVLHLIQMIRDESHRFAITFHRQRRNQRELRSGLLEVEGIGPARVRKLLTVFGSLDAIQQASAEQLEQVLSRKQAATLWERLHPAVASDAGASG